MLLARKGKVLLVSGKCDNRIVRFVPNALTVGRVVLTVVFLWMILHAGGMETAKPANFLLVAFILFVVTGLTDIVDGKVARMYDVTSKFGRIVDPLADKVLVCGAFVCFAIVGKPGLDGLITNDVVMRVIQISVAGIIISRELFVTILRQIAEARGVNFAATASGKIKMFLQTFGIGTVIIKWAYVSRAWGDWLTAVIFLCMVVVTVISGVSSVRRPRK